MEGKFPKFNSSLKPHDGCAPFHHLLNNAFATFVDWLQHGASFQFKLGFWRVLAIFLLKKKVENFWIWSALLWSDYKQRYYFHINYVPFLYINPNDNIVETFWSFRWFSKNIRCIFWKWKWPNRKKNWKIRKV